jgi:LmbE family N-acetylglucosaminyl deacetylase
MTRIMAAQRLLAAARAAPVASIASLVGGGPVLVLAPHPDDESLGCGGLIAACAREGISVTVALLTDGAGSHPGSQSHPPALLARLRVAEMRAALGALGLLADALHELGWPDQHAPIRGAGFVQAVAQVTRLARAVGAAVILAPWRHDPHCDHESAALIAAAAAEALGCRQLAYPVWGWTLPGTAPVSAGPALRFEAMAYLAEKRRAVACHHSQHGAVITDAPDGFALPPALLDACLGGYEVFFDEGRV